MARLITGTLYVDSYVATENPGEYTFTNAIFNNVADTTGNGAYDLDVGFIVLIPATDVNTASAVPGVVWRYKLTALSVIDPATINGTILWDDFGDPITETDLPTNGATAIITEYSQHLDLNYTVSQQVYPDLAAGVDIAALLSQIRTIIDNLSIGKEISLRYTSSLGIPSGGTRYLRSGQDIASSLCGDFIPNDSTLTTISVQLNEPDDISTYEIDIISSPSGTPTVINSLLLPLSTQNIAVTNLTSNIPANTEIGVRVVRLTGSGESQFRSITVNLLIH
jgi:hypothetical protein